MADNNKQATGLIIHGFAVGHAAAAALLAQTVVGDEAVLTFLTGSMIVAIVKMNGRHWTVEKALKFVGLFIGKYLGVRGAAFLIKWIPGIGNAANAAVTFTITEVLGWATYILVRDGNDDFENMTESERNQLWNQARNMREQEREESERLYNAMSEADKRAYRDAINGLKDRNISDTKRDELMNKIDEITRKYTS